MLTRVNLGSHDGTTELMMGSDELFDAEAGEGEYISTAYCKHCGTKFILLEGPDRWEAVGKPTVVDAAGSEHCPGCDRRIEFPID